MINNNLESTVRKYENVIMYRSGLFGIDCTQCRSVEVTTGIQYAQYNDAIRVIYLEKGKRKQRAFILDYKPWLRLTSVDKPATVPAQFVKSNGGSCSRYTSCDPRYETDFEDANIGLSWLLEIGVGDRRLC